MTGVDIAEKALDEASSRFLRAGLSFRPVRLDFFSSRLPPSFTSCFDAAVCNFSLHYAASSESCLRTAFSNFRDALLPSSPLVVVLPSFRSLQSLFEGEEGGEVKRDLFALSRGEGERGLPLSDYMPYLFHLPGAVRCTEWAVSEETLVRVGKEEGLVCEEQKSLLDVQADAMESGEMVDLSSRMGSRTFLSDAERETVSLYDFFLFRKE